MGYRYNYYFFDLLLFNNCIRIFVGFFIVARLKIRIYIYFPCDSLSKIISNILPNKINSKYNDIYIYICYVERINLDILISVAQLFIVKISYNRKLILIVNRK